MRSKEPISFRIRIALLAGAITGLIVIVFGVYLWRITYQNNLDGLDENIANLGRSNLQGFVRAGHWSRLQSSLEYVTGEQNPARYQLWVESRGRVEFVGEHWPESVNPSAYRESWRSRSEAPVTPLPPSNREPISKSNTPLSVESAVFFSHKEGDQKWRIGVLGNYFTTIGIAMDMDAFTERMDGLRIRYIIGSGMALAIAFSGAYVIARRSLRPVEILTEAVANVSEKGLNRRIEDRSYDKEHLKLVTMFNEMMDRLEKAFHQSSRFSADASHELKTPLARIQMELEESITEAPIDSKEQKIYSSLMEEIGKLRAIVDKLLLLSLSDAGKLRLSLEKTNLTEMIESVIEDCKAQKGERHFDTSIQNNVWIQCDPSLLEQAIQNIAINALKYSAEESVIRIQLEDLGSRVVLIFENQGAAIVGEDQERVFERFYQSDRSRAGLNSGIGLGLSLSREIVRAHGGEVVLERSDADGTVFVITIPKTSETI